jgi:hypothetical protein
MAFADLPPSVQAEYQRIGREREIASRQADRDQWVALLRVCAEMIGWTLAGLTLAGFAFRVTDYQTGMVLLYAGMIVNVGGVTFSIASAYIRGERRGDW